MKFVSFDDLLIPTILAEDEESQAQGLMFASWPPPVMSFVFKHPKVCNFWMKNTYVPLDIVFCRDGKIIEICKGVPLSEKHVGPKAEVDLVVELPSGTVQDFGITEKTKVAIINE